MTFLHNDHVARFDRFYPESPSRNHQDELSVINPQDLDLVGLVPRRKSQQKRQNVMSSIRSATDHGLCLDYVRDKIHVLPRVPSASTVVS